MTVIFVLPTCVQTSDTSPFPASNIVTLPMISSCVTSNPCRAANWRTSFRSNLRMCINANPMAMWI